MILLVLGMVLLIKDYGASVGELSSEIGRNSYGEGEKELTLDVKVNGNARDEITVTISEQMYEGEEVNKMFENCIKKIEK